MSTWDELCGERILMAIRTDVHHPFSDDAHGVAIGLASPDLSGETRWIDEIAIFIFEDSEDGARSSAMEPIVAKRSLDDFCDVDYIFAPVLVSRWTNKSADNGLDFIDTRNDKLILRVGTHNFDDWYRMFVCDWRPQNLHDNAVD